MNDDQFNKNDKQVYFNQIKGVIFELNDGEQFCSVTLKVGHENTREVNCQMKKYQFDKLTEKFAIGDKIVIRFFVSSKKKNDRWLTVINALEFFAE